MTERFKVLEHKGQDYIFDTNDAIGFGNPNVDLIELLGSSLNADEIVDLLNELNDENQYLKSLKWNQDCINEISIGIQQRQSLEMENEQLKQQIRDMSRFEHTGEHIRLSINIETGKLQRHIYATGQWFGDFDRVLCENWISKEDYQKFIDRVIEVYNTEFKGDDGMTAEVVKQNNRIYELEKENEQLKQSNERIIKDIDLALGFIRHKGYSLQDIKDYEDAKKEYEEDLANYRKGDVE